jgi:PII-like signaling protein
VSAEALKLTVYFGERDRSGGRFLADALFDAYETYGLASSVLLRGAEGFGIKHTLQTERLLSLSEDLPLVSIAVDTRERIQTALPEVAELTTHGLISLERARLLSEGVGTAELPAGACDAVRFTLYLGRAERAEGRPAYLAAIDVLRRHGVEGASALLGVDGTLHGERRRARFLSRNVNVPLMILAFGRPASLAAALPDLDRLLRHPLATVERVRLCKRDGELLAEPRHMPEHDDAGLPIWQKLIVHAEEQATAAGRPLHVELVRRLREAGAAGATVLRGIHGYYGERGPFGDRVWQLRRRVPVHTVIVDTPENIRRWWRIVDAVTAEAGLVTSELVPAGRAMGPEIRKGTLRLASLSAVLRKLPERDR